MASQRCFGARDGVRHAGAVTKLDGSRPDPNKKRGRQHAHRELRAQVAHDSIELRISKPSEPDAVETYTAPAITSITVCPMNRTREPQSIRTELPSSVRRAARDRVSVAITSPA